MMNYDDNKNNNDSNEDGDNNVILYAQQATVTCKLKLFIPNSCLAKNEVTLYLDRSTAHAFLVSKILEK